MISEQGSSMTGSREAHVAQQFSNKASEEQILPFCAKFSPRASQVRPRAFDHSAISTHGFSVVSQEQKQNQYYCMTMIQRLQYKWIMMIHFILISFECFLSFVGFIFLDSGEEKPWFPT